MSLQSEDRVVGVGLRLLDRRIPRLLGSGLRSATAHFFRIN